MKARSLLLVAAVGGFVWLNPPASTAGTPIPLRVLYVGHRAAEFEPLLKEHFAKTQSAVREDFQPQAAQAFDVVLLDWPQSDLARKNRSGDSPLGTR
jgi:hypothetical protein